MVEQPNFPDMEAVAKEHVAASIRIQANLRGFLSRTRRKVQQSSFYSEKVPNGSPAAPTVTCPPPASLNQQQPGAQRSPSTAGGTTTSPRLFNPQYIWTRSFGPADDSISMEVDYNAMSRTAAADPLPRDIPDTSDAKQLGEGSTTKLSSGLDATLRLGDLHEGQVTPPTERVTLPLPKEIQAAFQQEVVSGISISFSDQHPLFQDDDSPDFSLLRGAANASNASPRAATNGVPQNVHQPAIQYLNQNLSYTADQNVKQDANQALNHNPDPATAASPIPVEGANEHRSSTTPSSMTDDLALSREAGGTSIGLSLGFEPGCARLADTMVIGESAEQHSRADEADDHSSTILHLCQRKLPAQATASLIKAAEDERAECVKDEVDELEELGFCILDSKPRITEHMTVHNWVQFLDLRRIPSVSNGHCLYYALRNALHLSRPDKLPRGTVEQQTAWVKPVLLDALTYRLLHEPEQTQDDLLGLFARYSREGPQHDLLPEDMRIAVIQEISAVRQVPVSEPLPFQCWGGTEELRMATLGFQLDIYVLDEQSTEDVYPTKYITAYSSAAATAFRDAPLFFPLNTTEARTELLPMLSARQAIVLLRTGLAGSSHFEALSFTGPNSYISDGNQWSENKPEAT